MLNMQALFIAYASDFRMLTFFAICTLPVAFIIGSTNATFRERAWAPFGPDPPVLRKPIEPCHFPPKAEYPVTPRLVSRTTLSAHCNVPALGGQNIGTHHD